MVIAGRRFCRDRCDHYAIAFWVGEGHPRARADSPAWPAFSRFDQETATGRTTNEIAHNCVLRRTGGAAALLAPQYAAAQAKRVAFLDGPVADKYVGGLTRSFTETAKADGLEVSVVQSPFDPALQAQQMDDAIAKKVDAIVMMIMSQKALIPALTRAKEAHIPVILINTPIPQEDLYTAFVGEDSNNMGATAAKAMAEGLKGRTPAKVAIIAGSMDEGIAPARVAGVQERDGRTIRASRSLRSRKPIGRRPKPSAPPANCWRAFPDKAASTAFTP